MSTSSNYSLILILFFICSCAQVTNKKEHSHATPVPRVGSYAEADLMMEAILDHIENKKKYSCIKDEQDGYLLIRTLRPHIEERESEEKNGNVNIITNVLRPVNAPPFIPSWKEVKIRVGKKF